MGVRVAERGEVVGGATEQRCDPQQIRLRVADGDGLEGVGLLLARVVGALFNRQTQLGPTRHRHTPLKSEEPFNLACRAGDGELGAVDDDRSAGLGAPPGDVVEVADDGAVGQQRGETVERFEDRADVVAERGDGDPRDAGEATDRDAFTQVRQRESDPGGDRHAFRTAFRCRWQQRGDRCDQVGERLQGEVRHSDLQSFWCGRVVGGHRPSMLPTQKLARESADHPYPKLRPPLVAARLQRVRGV